MIVITILASLGLSAGLGALLIYNQLVRLLVRSESALLNIDVLLKLRHDLVPNLLETVKEYAVD
jgi:LemA protein